MSWIDGLRDRVTNLLHPSARDRDLSEEIRHHLHLESVRLAARGLDGPAARARALERFGDPAWVMQATRAERGTLSLEKSMHDLRSAARSLRKQPGFTVLALLTLALGVGATTAAYTVFDTVLLRPLPYHDAERLVLVRERTHDGVLSSPSYPNFNDWRAQAHTFSGVASEMYPFALTVTAGADPMRAIVMGVSREFFTVLGVQPLRGRAFAPDETRPDGPRAVMVSYAFWKAQLNGRADLGTIRVGDETTPVVGVLPAGFRFVDDADLFYPHDRIPGTCRSCRNYRVVARLAPGVTIAAARAEMTRVSRALLATYGNETAAVDAAVDPLRDYLVGSYHTTLLVVLGAAALVLLIACTNLVSAQLARGLNRGREMAVRAALGASRGRLVRQLFLESTLLAVCGSACGALSAWGFIAIVKVLGTGFVPRLDELHMNGRMLLFAALLSVVTTVLIGLYPALRLAGGDPGKLLHSVRGSTTSVRGVVWRLLIAFEVGMAVVLLVGSTLLVRTLHNILTADTGMQPHGIVTAALVAGDTVDLARLGQLQRELAALPGATGVAFANQMPFNWGNSSGPVRRPTDPLDRDYPAMAGFRLVSSEYFSVLRQPVLRGRSFAASDNSSAPMVTVITPGIAARLWPGQNPIGKLIATNYLMQGGGGHVTDTWLTVVGVVSEAANWSLPRGEQNEIYVPLAQHPTRAEGSLVAFVRAANDPHALIPSVRARLHTLVPEMPPRLATLDDRIARSAADRRFAMTALTLFSGIALLLAGIGIYGTMAYTVAARTHEIGVRMALGATPGGVRRAVLAEAALIAGGGIAAGLVAGLFATRYLAATLYGVSHADPLTYGAGAAILLGTALIGAYVPAWRSSRVDPLRAIRAE